MRTMTQKVAVVCSPRFRKAESVIDLIKWLSNNKDVEILNTGGAGANRQVREAAQRLRLDVEVVPVNHGDVDNPIRERNVRLCEKSDSVYVFWTPGDEDTAELFKTAVAMGVSHEIMTANKSERKKAVELVNEAQRYVVPRDADDVSDELREHYQ